MKKFAWGLAAIPLLALLATSCNKETVEAKGDAGKVLTFGVATGKQTLSRAAEVNLDYLMQGQQLTVQSYKTGEGSLNKSYVLAHNGSKWDYDGSATEYHPIFELNHFSVYPAVAPGLGTLVYDGTEASFDYTVPNELAAQTDLMAATATTTNDSEEDAKAMLLYSHLLSQVNFAIVGIEGIEITVDNIAVNGVKNTGTYTFGAAGWGSTAALNGASAYPYQATVSTNLEDADETVYNLRTEANALMLMPQTFVGGDGNFSFTYTMRNSLGALLTEENVPVSVDFGATELAAYTNRWEPGKRYLYVINFEAPYLLSFDVDIDSDWMDWEGDFIEVDAEDHLVPVP